MVTDMPKIMKRRTLNYRFTCRPFEDQSHCTLILEERRLDRDGTEYWHLIDERMVEKENYSAAVRQMCGASVAQLLPEGTV